MYNTTILSPSLPPYTPFLYNVYFACIYNTKCDLKNDTYIFIADCTLFEVTDTRSIISIFL